LDSKLNPEHPFADRSLSHDLSDLNVVEFLALLERRNFHLSIRDENLVINAPAALVDDHLRAEIRRRKADLLTLLRSTKEATPKSPLPPAKRGGRIPMTPGQQGMWVIDHFDPGNFAYNIPETFRFDFSLDLGALQRSVDFLLARHEILRTSFHEDEGELYQSIAEEAGTEIGITDLRSLGETEIAPRCRSLVLEHARRHFDLRFAPLLRFHIFRIAADRDVLLINVHHIIADLQSLFILRDELVACYQAFVAKTAPNLPALPVQFADYAVWADQQLRNGTEASQIQYWREKLAGLPPFLELPIQRPYPAKHNSEGAKHALVIPSGVQRAMTTVGRECGATQFMTFLAGFAVLIARFSGQHDFCIGSPVTHRTREETQRMIGLFMNMVAFRVRLTPQQSFRDVLQQVRATALEAYEHRDVPFQTLVRALRFNRRSPRSPIFQVMFGFDPAQVVAASAYQIDSDPETARYDLSLLLSESTDGKIYGYLEYRTSVFEQAEITALAGQFIDLLQEVTESPDRIGILQPR
jgi:hypothetical protein